MFGPDAPHFAAAVPDGSSDGDVRAWLAGRYAGLWERLFGRDGILLLMVSLGG